MLFKDFTLACCNSEKLKIFIRTHSYSKCVAIGLCEDFIVTGQFADMTVNQFFSWSDGDKDGSIYDSYIEVYLD